VQNWVNRFSIVSCENKTGWKGTRFWTTNLLIWSWRRFDCSLAGPAASLADKLQADLIPMQSSILRMPMQPYTTVNSCWRKVSIGGISEALESLGNRESPGEFLTRKTDLTEAARVVAKPNAKLQLISSEENIDSSS